MKNLQFSEELIQSIEEKLRALPAPPLTQRWQVLARLLPTLLEMKKRGHTNEALAQCLQEQGCDVPKGALRNYLARKRGTATKRSRKSRRTTRVDVATQPHAKPTLESQRASAPSTSGNDPGTRVTSLTPPLGAPVENKREGLVGKGKVAPPPRIAAVRNKSAT